MTTLTEEKSFDWFELLTALLLGAGAIGSAWAGYQGGQWGGRQAEAFGDAANLNTRAAKTYNEQTSHINHDYSIDIQAKKLIFEAMDAENEGDRKRNYEIASNLYTRYMTTEGYEDLGLPAEFIVPNENPKQKKEFQEAKILPEKALIETLEEELGEEYITEMLGSATAEFALADKRFDEGRKANNIGDEFSFIQVIYTISLFFAGLGVVFKTGIRWGMWGAGMLSFLLATAYLFKVPWA